MISRRAREIDGTRRLRNRRRCQYALPPMSVDAVAVLKMREGGRALLEARLGQGDLRGNAFEARGTDAVLWATLQRFPRSPAEERVIAGVLSTTLGDDLDRIHADARGVLLFPDVCQPRARTYDGIVTEVGSAGRWIKPLPAAKREASEADMTLQVGALVRVARALADAPADASDEELVARALSSFTPEEIVRLDEAAKRDGLASFEAHLRLTLRAVKF